MDTSTQERSKRRFRSAQEKQQILSEATAPGASVAAVARKYAVNANLIFAWLRLRKAGLLEGAAAAVPLLPVHVGTPTLLPDPDSRSPVARGTRVESGHIAVELSGATVRVHGHVEPRALAAVFAALRTR